jgi:hypothetical protein
MRLLLLAAAMFVIAAAAFADIVELKAGGKVEGKVKSVTPGEVVIESGGKEQKIERDKVRSIQLDGAAAPRPQTPAAAKDAMAALRNVQSIAGPGALHLDYTQAVSDADFAVSRYLREPEEAAAKAAMKEAVALYVFAGAAWDTRLKTYGYAALETDPLAEKCPTLKRVIAQEEKSAADDNARAKARFDRESKAQETAKAPPPPEPTPVVVEPGYVIATKGISAIWTCASDKVNDAQKLLDSPPPPAPAKK